MSQEQALGRSPSRGLDYLRPAIDHVVGCHEIGAGPDDRGAGEPHPCRPAPAPRRWDCATGRRPPAPGAHATTLPLVRPHSARRHVHAAPGLNPALHERLGRALAAPVDALSDAKVSGAFSSTRFHLFLQPVHRAHVVQRQPADTVEALEHVSAPSGLHPLPGVVHELYRLVRGEQQRLLVHAPGLRPLGPPHAPQHAPVRDARRRRLGTRACGGARPDLPWLGATQARICPLRFRSAIGSPVRDGLKHSHSL